MEGIARFWAKIQGVKKMKCKFYNLTMLEMHTLIYCLLGVQALVINAGWVTWMVFRLFGLGTKIDSGLHHWFGEM